MNDLLLVMVVLLANSMLNIVTWLIILGKAGFEVKSVIESVKDTIKVIKRE